MGLLYLISMPHLLGKLGYIQNVTSIRDFVLKRAAVQSGKKKLP